MGLLTSWIYPIRGVVFLLTTPQLLQLVLRFLGIVTAASFASTIIAFTLFWKPHMAVLGYFLGVNWLSKLLATLLLLGESAIPIFLVFDHRLKKLGRQLFDTTMQLRLGGAAPAGSSSHGEALATYQAATQHLQQRSALRTPSVSPLQPQDQQALNKLVAKQRQAEAAAQQGRSLAGAALSLAMRLMFKPQANESALIRKARDFATLGLSAVIPGAAVLLPLLMYRDSSVEVSTLMSRYWEAKGVTDGDAQQLLAEHYMNELRGFGLVATGLSYIPVLNWALSLSNHVAAALYAAHLESKGTPLLKTWWL